MHLERRLVEERRGDDEECIEPTSRLVNPLGDEVSREAVLELFLVLEREVGLGVGHRAGLEPAVEHLADSLQRWMAGSSRRDRHLRQ